MSSISNYPNTLTLSNGVINNYKEVTVPNTSYSKVVFEDGTVAVLVHTYYGGGWSTNYFDSPTKQHQYVFDSRIVLYVLSDEFKKHFSTRKITDEATKTYEDMMNSIFPNMIHPCVDSFAKLVVKFIPENTMFRIHEYDGAEGIEIFNPNNYMTS